MREMLTVSGVLERISVRHGVELAPHRLSGLFYRRKLDTRRCPVVSGIRRIPVDYVPVIEAYLQAHGIIPEGGHDGT